MKPSMKKLIFAIKLLINGTYILIDKFVINTLTYILWTDTNTQTDRKVKTEGVKILSNDIFYCKTLIASE